MTALTEVIKFIMTKQNHIKKLFSSPTKELFLMLFILLLLPLQAGSLSGL